jgi:hypothetical protein
MQEDALAQTAKGDGERSRIGSLRERLDFTVTPLERPVEQGLDISAKPGVGNA